MAFQLNADKIRPDLFHFNHLYRLHNLNHVKAFAFSYADYPSLAP